MPFVHPTFALDSTLAVPSPAPLDIFEAISSLFTQRTQSISCTMKLANGARVIRIYADFNNQTADGGYRILQSDDAPIEENITEIGVSSGDQVLLYQDDDDFEVEATLYYKFVEAIGREGWVAYPNWSTLTRKPTRP